MASNSDPPQNPLPGDATSTVTLPAVGLPRSSRYTILKLHGRGGMGEIWLAEDAHIGRQVAFKRIRADKVQAIDRFFAEAQVTGQLEHPGIVPVHELGRDQDEQPFYVMRLIHGRTLKEVISEYHAANKRGEADEERRWLRLLTIMVSLARTLSYAHSRGVIHRDLKPDNVMVGQYGETFVLDWGLCKLLGSPQAIAGEPAGHVRLSASYGSSATQDGEVVGTPLYMSPEMADGRIADEDPRTDVYLLGATLYEVLTNRPPRGGSTQREIVDLARTSAPVSPRKINPRIPRALEAICLKAMEYRIDDRYESAQAVADELESYLAGEPVAAYPESMARRLWRWAVRRKAAIARGAAASFLLILVGISAIAWQRERARHAAATERLAAAARLDQARQDAARFRQLEEQLRDQLADTLPVDDRIGLADPTAATVTWKNIQQVLGHWNKDLSDFPEEAGRAAIQQDYAELVLWRVQSLTAGPLTSEVAQELLADLQVIAGWHPALRSFERLRSLCLLHAGLMNAAEQSAERAKQHRHVAFDYFLEGESQRLAALALPSSDPQEIQRASRELLKEAIAQYQKCIDMSPQHFWAHIQKGRSHLVHRDELDEALAELDLAVALRPQSATAWTARGLALGVLGEIPAALHDLNYAIGLQGGSLKARLNRGAVLLLQGRDSWGAAERDFQTALKEDPGNIPAAYYLAMLEYQRQQFDSALDGCNDILRRARALRPALLLRLKIHLSQQNAELALADVTALSRSSDSPAAQAALHCSLLRNLASESPNEKTYLFTLGLAEQEGLKAAELGFATADLFDDLGAVQRQLPGKQHQAINALDKAFDANPAPELKAKLHLKRGEIRVQDGDFGPAAEDYREAVKIEGSGPIGQLTRAEGHALLGFIAARRRDATRAEREAALAMAQLRNVNNWETWWNLACVYTALSENDSDQQQELQDIAMLMLKNCLFQADRSKNRRKAIAAIRNDPTFKPLQERSDFQELITQPPEP